MLQADHSTLALLFHSLKHHFSPGTKFFQWRAQWGLQGAIFATDKTFSYYYLLAGDIRMLRDNERPALRDNGLGLVVVAAVE